VVTSRCERLRVDRERGTVRTSRAGIIVQRMVSLPSVTWALKASSPSEPPSGIDRGERRWLKTKNRDYWRYPLEIEGMRRATERSSR
jgi:hypothetical protein